MKRHSLEVELTVDKDDIDNKVATGPRSREKLRYILGLMHFLKKSL